MFDRFHLDVDEVIQGDIALRSRTLLLVFQVNCPGCFNYALPLAEAIHQERNRLGLSVIGLSTAFEDFDLNTVENTRALVEQGAIFGETQRSLGAKTYPGSLSFPIAVDAGIQRGVGATFARNGLSGTPTWLLVEPNGLVLGHYFGQLPTNFALRLETK